MGRVQIYRSSSPFRLPGAPWTPHPCQPICGPNLRRTNRMSGQYAVGFVPAHDEHWHTYPTRVAPELLRLHRELDPGAERGILDIGCGTGIVAEQFQRAGYRVTGLDASAGMLTRARDRLGSGAVLVHGDAADLTVDGTFPFAVSTYDTPNHIGDPAR